MPDIFVILGLPATIALMAVMFVVTLGAVGESPAATESRASAAGTAQVGEVPK